MSIVLQEVTFSSPTPDLRRIAEEIRARTGLEVSIAESTEAEKGNIYDVHAQLAFACAPEERIAVYTLRPGTRVDRYKIAFADLTTRPARLAQERTSPAAKAPDPEGRQMVYLKGLRKNELTLLFVTQLALERLGGVSPFPLSDRQRIEYDKPLTAAELDQRCRKHRFVWKLDGVLGIVLLPIIIPWTLLKWIVIALVSGVWKLGHMTKAALGFGSRPSAPRM